MTNEERAVIEAAVAWYKVPDSSSDTAGKWQKVGIAIENYLASQNEVKEIEEITSNPEYMTDLCFKREVINQLNETIRTVNKLARGK